MSAERGSYKGHATLTLKKAEADRYGLTFGIEKAKLILANLDAIESFVADEGGIPVNERRIADRIDGYDRDDLGESPDR